MTDLEAQLARHEGFRAHVYQCPAGKWTVGYGRNLEDNGITEAEALMLLRNDIAACSSELHAALPWSLRLPQPAQDVLINMAFNMGTRGLLKFKNFLAALQFGDYEQASKEMLASLWAKQVGKRAHELAYIIRGLENGPDSTRA
jgi:lysozyme